MDFSWSKEHLKLKAEVTEFAINEISGAAWINDEKQFFPRDLWKKCADFGIQKLALSKAYGGPCDEVDFLGAISAMEGFGYGCDDNGLAFALNAQMWTVQTPILHFGSEDQKKKYLIPMGRGEMIGAHALTEPDAGSDIFNMSLTADPSEDGYILNGKKHLITLAPASDFLLVFAMTNKPRGKWGVSAFLVDRDTPGLTMSEKYSKMGMRSIPIGSMVFEDCFIPKDALLGSEGLGFSILNHSLDYDRCCILASQLGRMERQLEESTAFVKSRVQFKSRISNFQSVSNRIVDMKMRLETSRLLLYKAAWLKATGQSALLESAMLKLHLSESFVASSLDAIRNGGGISYLTEHEIERDLRDAVGGVLYAGTSDIQRNIIAKLLGL